MGNEKRIIFGPFCLDLSNECLWKGSQAIMLRPKAFAVLHHLLRNPGRLVTKEELLNVVWPGTFVGDAVLKVAIRQIREALGDDPQSPRFIETAHRRGYRFIGPYQNVLSERMSAFRRVQLHLRIGEQTEVLYGERAREIAGELAMHFERGSKEKQAVKYLQQTAENDIRRFAYREAVVLARRGLHLLGRLPDTPVRAKLHL